MRRYPDADPVFEAWRARARAGSFEAAAKLCGFVPARGHSKGNDRAGPCPACGGRDRFSVHFIKRKFNCRHCAAKGNDALSLALVGDHVSFIEACEALSGEPRPSKIAAESEAERNARLERRAQHDREAEEDRKRRDAEADIYRTREREACHRLWSLARPIGAGIRTYFAARSLMLPASAMIREADEVGYFHGEIEDERGKKAPRLIHRGPAMLSQMLDNAGAFVGLHLTYLAPDWSAKATIADPETGEILNPKKMRGSKKGSHIVVRQPASIVAGEPVRLFAAEGIETDASVATALKIVGQLARNDIFWAFGDLGNLGGRAKATVAHPTLKTPKGRAQRVPGPDPDFGEAAVSIPRYVTHLFLLGDGDSERVLTEMTLERGRRRYAQERAALREADPSVPDLDIRIAMACDDMDFNDMLQGE